MTYCKMIGGVAALVSLVVGIVLVSTNSQVFNWIYRSQLVLSPSSASFPMWRDLPTPMYAKMYLFNVTNADEVTMNGAKPTLSELGPYVFYENHHKTKLVWNENNTVTYQQIRTWEHVPELSVGKLTDRVTILNPVAASIGEFLRTKIPSSMRPLVNIFLKAENEQVFVTHSVNDIIFNGFDDPLLKAMNGAKFFIKNYVPAGAFMDKFAFFYNRNGSDFVDGVFNMFTGAGQVSDMGKVHSWNYSTENFFPGECGRVKGGAGEFYPPNLDQTYIQMFSNDLCRSLKFNFNQVSYPHGIRTHEYVADASMFANGTVNPSNKCYNPQEVFLPSGVFNTSICRFGAPVFVSQPHFNLADPYYSSLVRGLNVDPAKHRTFLRIEPEAGVPVQVVARFQLNVLLDKVPGVTMFENVPRAFVPVMWFENSADVPSQMIFKMKLLANLKDILGGSGWAIFGLGFAAIIIIGILFSTRRRRREDTGPILSESLVDESDSENVFHD